MSKKKPKMPTYVAPPPPPPIPAPLAQAAAPTSTQLVDQAARKDKRRKGSSSILGSLLGSNAGTGSKGLLGE